MAESISLSKQNIISSKKLVDSEVSSSIITEDSFNDSKVKSTKIKLYLNDNSFINCEIGEEELFNLSYKLKTAVSQINERVKKLDN